MSLKSKITILLVFIFYSFLNPVCSNGESNHPDRFYQKLSTLCWISYAPTNFNPRENIYPSENSIEKDLSLLKKAGFSGVVTYGSEKTLGQIPKIAKKLGFKGIIMGIWEPGSHEEFRQAVVAKDYVDAYCVGHMDLNKRYDLAVLQRVISRLKEITGKPISTSESIQLYNKDSELIDIGDWLFPDAHLYWDTTGVRNPNKLFQKLVENYQRLEGISKRPILIKTVGFPTGGALDASEDNQEKFWGLILNNAKHLSERIRFVYFEAFDQPWKTWHTIESNWGIFKSDRGPKKGSRSIWGLHITYPIDFSLANYNERKPWLYIGLGIILIITIIFFSRFFKKPEPKDTRPILKFITEHKKLILLKDDIESEIHFRNSHDECFSILKFLINHLEEPMLCGEIIDKLENDASLSKKSILFKCTFDKQNECEVKRSTCKSYITLHNHRISVINEKIKDNNIGEIINIPRQSKWRLILNPEIKLAY